MAGRSGASKWVALVVSNAQVVFCGDFFQLPPIEDDKPSRNDHGRFAFDAPCWDSLFPLDSIVQLQSVFRQKDARFIKTLECMRRGTLSPAQNRLLASLDRKIDVSDGIEPVKLYVVLWHH